MSDASDNPLFRPTWATVDLGALARNYDLISRRLAGRAAIMAMVKADAYGHGAVRVSQALVRRGVRALGVATVEEGVELREAGIAVPVLVMGGLMGVGSPASKRMIEAELTPVIHSTHVLDSLEADAVRLGRTVPVHLKLDTGMSRLGVRPEALPAFLAHLVSCPHLALEGVMTHLAQGDCDKPSAEQMRLFLACREKIEAALGPVRVWHIANSAAILRGEEVVVAGAAECWVRPGLALFGDRDGTILDGGDGTAFGDAELSPVMGIESRAVLLKRIPAGTRVSYGGTFTTERPTRIAVVPIGYADGYPFRASGKAEVLVRGQRCPVLGRVTMDMIVVDVTDVADVAVNDQVVLLGAQGSERIALRELAAWSGTIPYELLCGISKRMPRVYR